MSNPPTLAPLTHRVAVRLAIEAARIYRQKQRVYKHPVWGWTWTLADDEEAQ